MEQNEMRELLQKYLDGKCTASERAMVDEWYAQYANQNPTKQIHQDIITEKQAAWNKINNKIAGKKEIKKLSIYKIVIAVIIIPFVLFITYKSIINNKTNVDKALKYTFLHAEKGTHKKVVLPDGSEVWLNGGSTIKFLEDYNKTNRQVILEEGEAYFIVRHNAQKTFTVQAGNVQTKDVGTAFNIRSYKFLNNVQVSVTEGSVVVGNEAGKKKNTTVIANKNEQISIAQDGAFKKRNIKGSDCVSWINNILQFNDEDLYTISKLLENEYHVPIQFKNEQLKQLRFTISFNSSDSLLSIIADLSLSGNFHFSKENNIILLK